MHTTKLRSLLALLRPKHWFKNVLVLAPVPFGLAAGGRLDATTLIAGLVAFCLASSAVYAFNDARDAAADRHHPRKRHRPVARGAIGVGEATLWSLGLFALALAILAIMASPTAVLVVVVYGVANTLYSLGLRDVPVADVTLLAAGVLLRVLLGCALIAVEPSGWLLACAIGIGFFLALSKRRWELTAGLPAAHRPSLATYRVRLLDAATVLTGVSTLALYAAWAANAEVLRPERDLASVPFVLVGMVGYLHAAATKTNGASPVDLILASPVVLLSGVGWVVAISWSLA